MAAPALLEDQVTLSPELVQELQKVPLLRELSPAEYPCLGELTLVTAEAGETLVHPGEVVDSFWILLSGEIQVVELLPSGQEILHYQYDPGSAFGEVPLLASIPSQVTLRTVSSCRMLRFRESAFWQLMTDCPEVRRSVLRNMAMRLQKVQHSAVHQEKMAALGTMAAGLMHELNNPGAAARRATAQLRECIVHLNEVSSRLHGRGISGEQLGCLDDLVRDAIRPAATPQLNSLEQSDAEDALGNWLDEIGVEHSWKIAPNLVAVGISSSDLSCAQATFPDTSFADAIAWLDAFVTSTQLIGIIEESVGRVTELVKAVKSYAYEGAGQLRSVDLNQSVHAALVILGHKLREKQVQLVKELSPNLPVVQCACKGLNQIWTNLLDNAIDAVEQGGRIELKTWAEQTGETQSVCIRIVDNGAGIAPEIQPHIFDPFFTTKAAGIGTGLGLGIVNRLVDQSGGTLHFSSEAGRTEFVVRLPAEVACAVPAH